MLIVDPVILGTLQTQELTDLGSMVKVRHTDSQEEVAIQQVVKLNPEARTVSKKINYNGNKSNKYKGVLNSVINSKNIDIKCWVIKINYARASGI